MAKKGPKIEIYTRPGCGYCSLTTRLLQNKSLPFTEHDVYRQPQRLTEMRSRTNGRTYPQVFINNLSIGGFEELLMLVQQNRIPKTGDTGCLPH